MASVCPKCSSTSVVDDDHGGQSHRVCTNCGYVISSATSFEQERDYYGGATSCNSAGSFQSSNLGRGRNIRREDPDALSKRLIQWIVYLREVCSMLNLTDEMKRGVIDLFSRAFRGSLNRKQKLKKQALGGAAMFITCRQHNWPVVLSDISTVVQCSVADLFAMKQALTREFNVQIPTANIEDIVKGVLEKYGFSDRTFVVKTVKVVSLAKDAWITCGRSYDAVIVAAAFFVWKSSEGRGKANKIPAFCQQLSVKPPGQTARRVREIRSILVQLVGKIPWLKSKKVTPELATLYLDDILQNKKYLIRVISCVQPPKDEDCSEDAEAAKTGETTPGTHGCGISDASIPSSPMLPPSWKKRKLCVYNGDTDMDAHCKKQAMTSLENWNQEAANVDEELTDRDIPESEMHLYLRSESEVADLELIQQTLLAQEKSP